MMAEDAAEFRRPRVEHVGRSKFLTPVLEPSASCRHQCTKHGANSEWSWTKCQTCGMIEQIPKLEVGLLSQWNSVMRFQEPDYVTPQAKKAEKEESKKKKNPGTPGPATHGMNSTVPPLPFPNEGRLAWRPNWWTLGRPRLRRGTTPRWRPGADRPRGDAYGGREHREAVRQDRIGTSGTDAEVAWSPGDGGCPGHPLVSPVSAGGSGNCGAYGQGCLLLPDVWRSEVGLRVETSAHRALPDWRVQSTCDPPESVPRFRLIGWASQERTKQVMMNLDGIDGLVELNRSLVYWCHGDYAGRDRWNVLDIDHQPTGPYDLQACMTTLVVQELNDEFIDYIREIDLDPMEVTLDKPVKKELTAAIDRGVEAQWPGPERQGTYLPVDVDLNWVIHETLEMKWKEVWRDYYGQAMLVALQPKVTLIPRCGPGHRNVRWMVGLKRPGEKWQWLEKGVSGELPPGCREFHNPVVLYRWPELKAPESRGEGLGASTTYATTSELSQREKSEVLRAHVNLGHPNTREFVRLLKAAGTRENIVQYVSFDFNVVIGVDLLFVAGIRDNADLPVINITCLGTLYSVFGLVDVKRRTSTNVWAAFVRLWLRVFGAPQCVLFDEGKEFTAGPFQDGLETHGIQPVEINRQAPFELGTVERLGGMFKEAYYRTRELLQPQSMEEVEDIIFETS
eukprot:s200_g7.t1